LAGLGAAAGSGAGTADLVTAECGTGAGAVATLATGLDGVGLAGAALATGLAVGFSTGFAGVLALVLEAGFAAGLATGLATGFAELDLAAGFAAGFFTAGGDFLAAGLVAVGRLTGVLLTEISSQRRLYPLRAALSGLAARFGRRGL